MPEMDGLETLRRIKEQDEEVDVIMVSALNLARKAVDAIKLGAYDYITKPYEPEDILSTVARVVSKRKLHKELDFLRKEVEASRGFDQIISKNKRMLEIFEGDTPLAIGATSKAIVIANSENCVALSTKINSRLPCWCTQLDKAKTHKQNPLTDNCVNDRCANNMTACKCVNVRDSPSLSRSWTIRNQH